MTADRLILGRGAFPYRCDVAGEPYLGALRSGSTNASMTGLPSTGNSGIAVGTMSLMPWTIRPAGDTMVPVP